MLRCAIRPRRRTSAAFALLRRFPFRYHVTGSTDRWGSTCNGTRAARLVQAIFPAGPRGTPRNIESQCSTIWRRWP
jgi:hypothetical protein